MAARCEDTYAGEPPLGERDAAISLPWPDLLLVQKTLTALAMPCGLIWLLLLGGTLLTWQRRHVWRSYLLLLLLLFTLAGNSVFASLLTSWLQQPFAEIDPLDAGDFDAVAVLGGGTSTEPSGYTHLNTSGDRVMLAARLYLMGKTSTLVTADEKVTWSSGDRIGFGEETRIIWTQLRIPTEDVVFISGRNTLEEISSLATLIDERQWERVGLVTSAWHMRRAMRLARTHEVELEPLPADFRGGQIIWSDFALIPTGDAISDIQIGMKELLAMAVGR